LFCCGYLSAIEVEGIIGSDTVWSPENNPYQVIDDIEVPEGITLTIEPGVRVEFMDYHRFQIYGSLLSVGTESDSIFFTSGRIDPTTGDWYAINFIEEPSSNSVLTKTIIEYSNAGALCENSSPGIYNNKFINNHTGIVCYDNSLFLVIHDNILVNNSWGIYCNNSEAIFRYNYLSDNEEYGIYCTENSSPTITNNVIKTTMGIAIIIKENSVPVVSQNNFLDNETCISIEDNADPVIFNNIFYASGTGIDIDETSIPSSVGYNLFWLNTVDLSEDVLPGFGELTEINANGDECDVYYNLFLDPEFLDPENGDFHLAESSPAIDAGNPGHDYTDPDGTVADLGALYYQQGPLIPLADFSAEPLQGGAPLAVQFTNLSLYGAETYLWDFGDGDTSTACDPLHIYENSGDYTVTLSAYGENGSDTFMKEDYIEVIPEEEALMGSLSGVLSNDYIYSVFDDIYVNMGDTLIIEPGVTVRFMDHYSFTIYGTLLAEGTETDSIYFTSGKAEPAISDWDKIEITGYSSSNSIIAFCNIEYNENGISCNTHSSLDISNSRICNSNMHGIEVINFASININGCNIYNCHIGTVCEYNSEAVIDSTFYENNDAALRNDFESSTEITNCQLTNNGTGLMNDYDSELYVDNCEIRNCYYYSGIQSNNDSNLEVVNSLIANCEYHGINAYDCPELVIDNNTITNNTRYGIQVGSSTAFITDVTISNNYISGNSNGIYTRSPTYPVIYANTICNNQNHGINFSYLSSYDIPTEVAYNLIYGNGAAGIYTSENVGYAFIDIYNNTIAYNQSAIINIEDDNFSIINNIIYENQMGISSCEELVCLEYNLFWENDTTAVMQIPDGFGDITTQNANGDSCDTYYNLFLNPLFADPENDDFHLIGNSPAIDAGNPAPEYMDHDGTTGDIGAFYYDQSDNDENEIPEQPIRLLWNYPNPFNPQTTISFYTTEGTEIYPSWRNAELNIYNIKGQRVREFKIENVKCKIYSVVWDGKDDNGREMPSGVYLYKLSGGNVNRTGRMVMIK